VREGKKGIQYRREAEEEGGSSQKKNKGGLGKDEREETIWKERKSGQQLGGKPN